MSQSDMHEYNLSNIFLFHGCMQPLSTPVKITSSSTFNSSSSQLRVAVSRRGICSAWAENLLCNASAWCQLLCSCHWWRPQCPLLNHCPLVQHMSHIPPSLHSHFDLFRFVSFCLCCFNHSFLCLSPFVVLLVRYFISSNAFRRLTIRWCTVQPWQHSICLSSSTFHHNNNQKDENFERILLGLYTSWYLNYKSLKSSSKQCSQTFTQKDRIRLMKRSWAQGMKDQHELLPSFSLFIMSGFTVTCLGTFFQVFFPDFFRYLDDKFSEFLHISELAD